MNNQKVSVIIPAYNEEKFIKNTIEGYSGQDYPVEIIVVVNGSIDKTYEIAKSRADKTLNFSDKMGVSAARNEGAKIAMGDIFIFSDADSWLEIQGVKKIATEVIASGVVGSVFGKDIKNTLKGRMFFFFKNWAHRLKIYEEVVDGVIFCSRDVFLKIGGFNKKKEPAELYDFVTKAKKAGAKYKIITDCYAFTSMRRYEKKGYFKTIFFWIGWKILNIFKKNNNLAKNYYEETKNV